MFFQSFFSGIILSQSEAAAYNFDCVKVPIFSPNFPTFGLNTEGYTVSLRSDLIWENTDQNNSVHGIFKPCFVNFFYDISYKDTLIYFKLTWLGQEYRKSCI